MGDNKLGPALFIALGIFGIYLVLTGKAQNLIAAANGTSNANTSQQSGTGGVGGLGSSSQTGGYGTGVTPSPSLSGMPTVNAASYSLYGNNAQSVAATNSQATYGANPELDGAIAENSNAVAEELGLLYPTAPFNVGTVTTPGALGYNYLMGYA